jgi:hypothetical protein
MLKESVSCSFYLIFKKEKVMSGMITKAMSCFSGGVSAAKGLAGTGKHAADMAGDKAKTGADTMAARNASVSGAGNGVNNLQDQGAQKQITDNESNLARTEKTASSDARTQLGIGRIKMLLSQVSGLVEMMKEAGKAAKNAASQ